MKKKKGRPIDNANLDVQPLKNWLRRNPSNWAAIKCQALISISQGASVSETCRVLCVTRESLRIWRKVFRAEGPAGFVMHKKTGRKSKLTKEIDNMLRAVLVQSPAVFSLDGDRWTGRTMQQYLSSQGLDVSLRTSLYWLKKIRSKYGL